ncbi:hypothetical protein ASZ78_006390 [Callipepla squamata]|uniref:Coiled-coil domain-containing protein n=1 Tax=Callipepla squamata TaxID=9009 RepID=A0A226N668_CALSU|nr:hypothetical protein ASZ78_006390 [Callipepla squamata]
MEHEDRLRDSKSQEGHRRGEERDWKRAGHRRPSPSPHSVTQEKVGDYRKDSGTKLRGTKQTVYDKPRREQELSDAEIARKLQEEELLANQADQMAAQVAQDEEIARLLMAEEKKALKKGKEKEKSSFERKRHDQDWKHDASESPRSRSKEGPETQRHKSDKSSRSQPLLDDFEHARYYTSQPSPLRQFSKPEHSPKGRIQSVAGSAFGWCNFCLLIGKITQALSLLAQEEPIESGEMLLKILTVEFSEIKWK